MSKLKLQEYRMGVDVRPDWFTDRVNDNRIITYTDDPDQGPFKFRKTYCDIKDYTGKILRANYGDYILWYGDEIFSVVTPEIFELEF